MAFWWEVGEVVERDGLGRSPVDDGLLSSGGLQDRCCCGTCVDSIGLTC